MIFITCLAKLDFGTGKSFKITISEDKRCFLIEEFFLLKERIIKYMMRVY